MPKAVGKEKRLSKDLPIVVIGGGIGGLSSALDLASSGLEVIVIEKEHNLGGKIRQVFSAGQGIDSGPTVFTMRWVFDDLFEKAGSSLEQELNIDLLKVLARHAWSKDEKLDLFSNREKSAQAIARFSSTAEANRFHQFCDQIHALYRTLEKPYMLSQRPSFTSMMSDLGTAGSKVLMDIGLFSNLWKSLEKYFHDPRLQQLFARYATYCGSSPFQAPATLMLIAEVEMQGVWSVQGGMIALTQAISKLAEQKGVRFMKGVNCEEILQSAGKVSGVRLNNGDTIHCESLIFNGDVAALSAGLLGDANRSAIPSVKSKNRSLSALTWSMTAKTEGFPLLRHNVFFNTDYRSEFSDIFDYGRLPRRPTVYVCAQDQYDTAVQHDTPERLLCLVNAPALGDRQQPKQDEIEACKTQIFSLLERCGLNIQMQDAQVVQTSPTQFNQLFPATGGALYGQANHGWMETFKRPSALSSITGLYLAGGSVHPGAGVPMAALSGRMAAASLMAHLGLTKRSNRVLISGGISTL